MAPVKSLVFLPMAFLAGQHGFALFAPYLCLMVALGHFVEWRRRQRAAAVVALAG